MGSVVTLSENDNSKCSSRVGLSLGVALTIGLAFLSWLAPNVVVRLADTALDFQFRLRGERSPGQEVILVLVDEKSLKEIGRWPWSRNKQALLLDQIGVGKPRVIGLDIIYAEPESDNAHELKDWLAAERRKRTLDGKALRLFEAHLQTMDPDRRFAQSLTEVGRVVIAVPFLVRETSADSLSDGSHSLTETLRRSEFMLVKQTKSAEVPHPFEAARILPPLDIFAGQVKGFGHVYRLPDYDGVTRREVLALRHGDAYYPSFALEVARLYLGLSREKMALMLGDGVQLGSAFVPADQKIRMLINYSGRELRFPWVSATDVLHHRVPPEFFHDKVVLVGTAALGAYDQLSTPFSANFAGTEKNATVIENILHQRFLTAGLWSGPIELTVVLFFGLALTSVLTRVRAFPGTCLTIGTFISYIGTAQAMFVVQGLCLPIVMPTLTIGSVFIVTTVLNFIVKERQARDIHSMFASYVSPRIVQELMKSPSKATIGGQRKELSMLFADLVGFTTFSEHRPAEAVVDQLNEYLSAMTDVIFQWNGTLDKFVGDEIVVFWGAPLEQSDHAELAVQCAVEMRARLTVLQRQWKAQGRPILENGIGINTGVALVGNIGADGKKMDYTMIGDHVNLAARVQELTRTLGHPLLLTEFTAAKLKSRINPDSPQVGHMELRKLRTVTVKGRQEPVGVYTVACRPESVGVNSAITQVS